MNKNIEKLMNDIDICVSRKEKEALRYFENIDEIKKECEKNLGFKEHYFWHMNFNSSDLTHLKNIFTACNCLNFARFDRYVEKEFTRISEITNIEQDVLMFMYNDYLKNKDDK